MSRISNQVMKRDFSVIAFFAMMIIGLFAQPSPIYINLGTVSQAPQIDAKAFYNAGNFDVGGFSISSLGLVVVGNGGFSGGASIPFSTQNTLNWTNDNSGVMGTGGGYLFDYATTNSRLPAANFINKGTVSAGDIIIANATNILSSGFLVSGREGLIRLKGDNVDLTRGGLAVSEFTHSLILDRLQAGLGPIFLTHKALPMFIGVWAPMDMWIRKIELGQ